MELRKLTLAQSPPLLLVLAGMLLVALGALAQEAPADRQPAKPASPISDLTDLEPTADDLVGALALDTPPPLRTRGAPEPRCDYFWKQRTRGDEPSAAKVAAVKVLFEFDSDQLTQAARESLEALGKALTSNALAPCCFEIQGHTDIVGSEEYNLRLSKRRAEAVVQFLAEGFGIDRQRLLPIGFGEQQPMSENETEDGRQKNRRVQVVNLGYGQVGLGSE